MALECRIGYNAGTVVRLTIFTTTHIVHPPYILGAKPIGSKMLCGYWNCLILNRNRWPQPCVGVDEGHLNAIIWMVNYKMNTTIIITEEKQCY